MQTNQPIDQKALAARFGAENLERRLQRQKRYSRHSWTLRSILSRPEHLIGSMQFLWLFLKLTGLWNRGRQNFRDLQVVTNEVSLPDLPDALDGFRILHLSDLHLDSDDALVDVIKDRIEGLDHDICVLTGDYSLGAHGDHDRAMSLLAELMPAFTKPVYGVLGNHGFIEVAPTMETMGIRMLLNEHVMIVRGGEQFCLAGVDDIWYYDTADLDRALEGSPSDCIKVLLAHNPDFCKLACKAGVDLMLSGHTHGGQIRLPGERVVITHTSMPKEYFWGSWEYDGVSGYTSPGVGGSGLPVRFRCPPEAIVHTLRRPASSQPERSGKPE